jgi:RNA polymerase sigma-70 factor (ECF subfamily)
MHTGDTRLNQIVTLWSEIRAAHNDADAQRQQARERLLDRYSGAIYRYLLGALGDAEAAHDLHQEFAVRFLSGRLQGVDREQGRFREFVKGVLYNLIAEHHQRKARRERQMVDEVPDRAGPCAIAQQREEEFRHSWRQELLSRSWAALKSHEQSSEQPFYSVLFWRAQHPEQSSQEMADALGERLGRPISAANVRKMLERARGVFGDLLVEEVIHSLAVANRDTVAEELAELGLLEMMREALERRFAES